MPYKMFDLATIELKPLSERTHDIDIQVVKSLDDDIPYNGDPRYDSLAEQILLAREKKATVIMMYGAHVIRTGNALFMIEMMKRGMFSHFATNGAGAIHDFEFALIGATCESVAKYISSGQFGLWTETGLINEAVKEGDAMGLGFGESIGKYIWERDFPYKKKSVLAMGYHLGIPCTVHVGIGNDIIHEHPNFDAAATGRTSYRDFLIYAESVRNLEHGVFLNFGSAVTGPEVYLKALAMARNAAHKEGYKITDFTTAVFDILPIEGNDFSSSPEKTDPRYYFRPWKTILTRTVADGGRSMYFSSEHQVSVPNLVKRIMNQMEDNNE